MTFFVTFHQTDDINRLSLLVDFLQSKFRNKEQAEMQHDTHCLEFALANNLDYEVSTNGEWNFYANNLRRA